jgi:hypothetical protein
MDIQAYAKAVRRHDWTSCMSDSSEVTRRGRESRAALYAQSGISPNHKRIWELATAWNDNFMWDGPNERCSAEKRYEDGWRWAGAYLWVHGIRLTEEGCKGLVQPIGETSRHNQDITGMPKWKEIDALVGH